MTTLTEQWKPVPHQKFSDRYLVSNTGKVYSVTSKKELAPQPVRGYLFVVLCRGSRKLRKQILVHRLVAKAFIPNPHNKRCINHLDFDPTNNNADNLEWCTHKENIQYSIKADRFNWRHGSKHKGAKLNEDDVREMREQHTSGTSIHKLSRDYKIDRKTVRDLLTRKSWKHVL